MKITPESILKLRTQLGDTQGEFAQRVGVRQPTVSDWETGTRKPSRMAEILLNLIAEHTKKGRKK